MKRPLAPWAGWWAWTDVKVGWHEAGYIRKTYPEPVRGWRKMWRAGFHYGYDYGFGWMMACAFRRR